MLQGRIGIALGSGAARGWAHVGVLRGLAEAGIEPEIVAGSSAGTVVGLAYATGRLDALEAWARQLDRRQVMSLLDLSLRGGALRGRRIVDQVASLLPEGRLEDTAKHGFAAVATDLESGREVWLRDGPIREVLHASCAVPGLVSPVKRNDRWLVDGGVVDPVPVSLCRALGADTVIAVDLNTSLLNRRFQGERAEEPGGFQQAWGELRQRLGVPAAEPSDDGIRPSLYEVLNNTLEIMQVRITRSRMAGDPPELLIAPRLPHFALLDLHRADEAIEEGRQAAKRALATLLA